MSSISHLKASLITSKWKIVIHVIFWVAYAFANYLIAYNVVGSVAFAGGFVIITLVVNLGLVYFHLLHLLPKYLSSRQLRHYFMLLLVAMVGAAIFRLLCLEGVGNYVPLDKEPSLGYKIGISFMSSVIVIIITAPFYLLDDWLNMENGENETKENEEKGMSRTCFFIKTDQKLVKIYFQDITHVESLRDFVRIHTPHGRYLSQHTMQKMIALLPEDQFMRIHRSHIISFDKISAVSGNLVEIGAIKLPVGKTYRTAFFERLHS